VSPGLQVEVQELVQGKRRLVWVNVEDTLEHALTVLAEHSILAVPVRVRPAPRGGGRGAAAGVLRPGELLRSMQPGFLAQGTILVRQQPVN